VISETRQKQHCDETRRGGSDEQIVGIFCLMQSVDRVSFTATSSGGTT